MANKAKVPEKKYHYILQLLCTECGTVPEKVGPCPKCGSMSFIRHYIAKEDK